MRDYVGPIILIVAAVALSGCASSPYQRVMPGPVAVGSLTVTADDGWNALTSTGLKKGAEIWTRDGELLNRVFLLPDIESGETLLKKPDEKAAIPPFRSDMLPHEIAELVESWISKAFGEGDSLVESSGLRPTTYADLQGFTFDLSLALSDGPDYQGIVGGFVVDGRLSLVIFFGAVPYYFDRDREGAAALIASTRHVAAL